MNENARVYSIKKLSSMKLCLKRIMRSKAFEVAKTVSHSGGQEIWMMAHFH